MKNIMHPITASPSTGFFKSLCRTIATSSPAFFALILLSFVINFVPAGADDRQEYTQEPLPRILDFDTAVQRVLNQSYTLNAASQDAQFSEGQRKQASLYPNPIFAYELDPLGKAVGFDNPWNMRQEICTLSQLIETASKRQKRTTVASYQYYAALCGYEVSKLDLLNRLSKAFIAVVAAQELLALAKDQKRIAEQILRIATEKVEAGKTSLIQQRKSEVAYSSASLVLQRAEAELITSKNWLALLWSSRCPDFDAVIFPFFDIAPPVPLEECLTELCSQPEIVQSLHEYYAAYHTVKLEKAKRVPDVNLTLGYMYEEGARGLVAAIAVPIPLFDRNQGNIKSAYADMIKTEEQGKQLRFILENKLSNSHIELVRAYREAECLRTVILQSAEQAFELAEEGYKEGKFEHLDVLDAQRTLFESRERFIQALVNYHNRRADIDYLNSQTD